VPSSGRRLGAQDRLLVSAAGEVLARAYVAGRQTVGAAVRGRSGRIHVGVNLNGVHSPCAEAVALGAAAVAGDLPVRDMVAVCRRQGRSVVLSPCGNCRQLLYDHSPRAFVIVRSPGGALRRLTAREALPAPFGSFDDD
jgi:cytidine deaminase